MCVLKPGIFALLKFILLSNFLLQSTTSKILLNISSQWWESNRPSAWPFWEQGPRQLHWLSSHKTCHDCVASSDSPNHLLKIARANLFSSEYWKTEIENAIYWPMFKVVTETSVELRPWDLKLEVVLEYLGYISIVMPRERGLGQRWIGSLGLADAIYYIQNG